MTRIHRPALLRAVAALLGALALGAPGVARAQADINPPLTNALLLVDTSGSMESKADGSTVTCNPASVAAVNDKSRWIDVIEVLTGTIDDYTCQQIVRTDSTTFKTGEYAPGFPPYDYLYPIPYHRPLSAGCAPSPGVQSSNPFIYPASGAINYHRYDSAASCSFSQRGNDGLLDAFRGDVRFGLMTFDTATDPSTGFTGAMASAVTDMPGGQKGLWSYVPVTSAKGAPSGCSTTTDQEVGARNAAAPPWEGRMVNFGNPYDGVRAYDAKNNHIQDVLLATRPYGATPIAGMLQDARDFLLNDKNKDPDRAPASLQDSDVASDFGPWEDPYLKCNNPRKQVVILLTDGAPNLDLRPYCTDSGEAPMGICPFDLPENITKDLNTAASTHAKIPTYVVGFALDKVDDDNNPATPKLDCNTITATDVANTSTSLCGKPANASNKDLQACCTLQRIAIGGGTTAYFASDRNKLKSNLADILSSTLPATSRTQPVASQGSSNGGSGGFQFFSGFTPIAGKPWVGTLQRQRIVCDDLSNPGIPTPKAIDPLKGDDFAANVGVGGPDARRIYSVLGGATVSDPIKQSVTIRPTIGSTDLDGVGTYSGHFYSGNSRYFVDNMPTAATAIPTASCVDQNGTVISSATICQAQYLQWWAGYNNGQSTVTSRCVGGPSCQLLGDIEHSTPAVVDRPVNTIRDDSYARFVVEQQYRPKVLYSSSNDGLLHAFKVQSNDPAEKNDDTKKVLTGSASNELWAFAPPAVLPNLYHLYPHTHQPLLDGVPVVRDVAAAIPAVANQIPTVFERTASAAQSGNSAWRTVLVQSFGSAHPGYFALDVTTPKPDADNPDDVTKGGPRMLWQLTTDKQDKNLFGRGGSTPTITTLFFDPLGGSDIREIPVAVLPGGPGGTQVTSGTGCPATGRDFSDVALDASFPPRPKVHCYDFSTNSEMGARSLTIVRLDTGEIIRTFRQSKTEVSVELQNRVTAADIDSPITGTPVAFPGFVGQVADRIFVGDQDGRVWRVNVASANPADWTMKLFMDLYPSSFAASAGRKFDEGQPVIVPPVVSVDPDNNLVLDIATGDQEGLGAAQNQYNYVYSITEKVNTTRTGYTTQVNWYKEFGAGDRVVGPMSLFSNGLYFGTFTPAPDGDVCTVGTSKIWGMDYITPQPGGDISTGGKAVVGTAQLIQSITSAVAFGPSIVQMPTCSTDDNIPLSDGIFGYGRTVNVSNIQTGSFQLVMQTGSNRTASDVPTAAIGVKSITLPTLPSMSSIQAWASIVE